MKCIISSAAYFRRDMKHCTEFYVITSSVESIYNVAYCTT